MSKRKITVHERWIEFDGKVYHQWSFDGKTWETEQGAYVEPPFVKFQQASEKGDRE